MTKSQIRFVPAQKESTYLRMALMGPSGSGKTYTALQLATHLAQSTDSKIAVICTEGRAARKLADLFDFDVFDMGGHYHPDTYCKAITTAVKAGYKVLIIDSLSHAWNGAGGVLEIVDQAGAKMGGNKFAGWSKGRPAHNKLVNTILNAHIHIIGTLRSKTEWQINEKGKPQKVGLAAIQDSDFEYEFDVVGMMGMDHRMTITKSRCTHIPVNAEQADSQHMAHTLHAWLTEGVEAPDLKTVGEGYLDQTAKRERLNELFETLGIKNADTTAFKPYLKQLGITRFSEFVGSEDELHSAITNIHSQLHPPAQKGIQTLEALRQHCKAQITSTISDSEIARLAGVDTITDLAGKDLNLQADIILAAFETEMRNSRNPHSPRTSPTSLKRKTTRTHFPRVVKTREQQTPQKYRDRRLRRLLHARRYDTRITHHHTDRQTRQVGHRLG